MATESIIALVTDLGAFAFILWLVQRTFSVTIPRLATSFENAVKALQEAFERQADKQRDDFREVVQQQRDDFGTMMQREQEIHASQTDKLVKAIENLGREIKES